MFKNKINFRLSQRPNTFVKPKKDWALYAWFEGDDQYSNAWVIESWLKKPTEKQLDQTITMIIRSIEFYYKRGIRKPDFKLDVEQVKIMEENK
jgi:hypothetical protein